VVTPLRKKYSLQIAISTLFITISVVIGVVLTWQSFNKTSDIILNSAHELYKQEAKELSLDMKATYGSIAGGLRQFRLSPATHATTFEERIAYLPSFQAVLDSEPSIFAVGIGYGNGDYLGFSWADSDYVRENFHVPDGATYVLSYIKNEQPDELSEMEFSTGRLYTIYFDGNLNEVERGSAKETGFDPRLRPWYQQAKDEPSATVPYVFYDSKIVGLTAMSKAAAPGAVVVFDITLENLSETIAKYQLTPGSEVVLINAEGQAFAYKDQSKILVQSSGVEGALRLANLKQLDSDVLAYVGTFILTEEQDFDFDYGGQQWIGSARIVAKPGGVDLYALMLSPVEELLAEAITIRDQLIFSALMVLLLFIPVIWYTADRISTPLRTLSDEAEAISRFNFEKTQAKQSFIKEVDELDAVMSMMKSTISKFIQLINSLAGEQDLDVLLKSITKETMLICKSDAALIYLMDEQDDLLKADFLYNKNDEQFTSVDLPALSLDDAESLFAQADGVNQKSCVIQVTKDGDSQLVPLLDAFGEDELVSIVLPLQNRSNEIIGLLCFFYFDKASAVNLKSIEFVEALSGFAAVTLESRQLLHMQEALLHAFIKLIAGAIDAKSPYTAGHCQRVPAITLMLAEAACASKEKNFRGFNLDDKQWEELSIACWLHDCGKVTTPEYVVDKATKLETIYDRIHEVRTRFEVLKRDAEIRCWQQIADGGGRESLLRELEEECKQLDDDFAFVAECNVGGEFMADDKIERLQVIAARTWQRTLDDNLGLSWEERERKEGIDKSLPVEEKLLADKVEHIIARRESDKMPVDNQWGFNVDTPEHKYNRGELYNLSVKRGTLSEEERYMINGHMIQTIIMLNNLPYPKSLRNVPLIAGSHHETMDGKGYPKRLKMSEQPLTARMMVIADIFEALTASDRPYKKSKTLSESLKILSFMRNDKHIDSDLFDLFLRSGVYLEYANKFLAAEQIDEVNIEDYLS
jgi:HD-GYP domain-containing protein (c-di-GMP phosphodiesterase class II)